MPRITELCNHLADRFRFEESKVQGYARILREAGLLTTGARGVNAPDATALDAARLLIAMMLRAKKDDAAEAVKLFGSFQPVVIGPSETPGGTERLLGNRCDDAVAMILVAASKIEPDQTFQRRFDFSITRDLAYASITVGTWAGDDDPRQELDDFSGWDSCEFRFLHSEFINRAPEDGPSDELVATWNHYRSGFHEVPQVFNEDLIAIGQFIAGRSE